MVLQYHCKIICTYSTSGVAGPRNLPGSSISDPKRVVNSGYLGGRQPEFVEGHWFRQTQPTYPPFIERIRKDLPERCECTLYVNLSLSYSHQNSFREALANSYNNSIINLRERFYVAAGKSRVASTPALSGRLRIESSPLCCWTKL